MKFALNNKYPIDTEEKLIKAAEFFDKNLSRFHPEDRVKIANNLDSRSSELNVNLNKSWITNYTRMEKSASLSPDFKKSMEMRKEACVRHNIKIERMDELGEDPSPTEILDEIIKKSSDFTSKEILDTVIEFDKKAGIEYLYDQQIVDPFITVFGSLNNPEFDSVKIAGDSTQYDLIRASRDQEKLAAIEDKLGKNFAESFRQNPITSIDDLKSPEKTVLSIITR